MASYLELKAQAEKLLQQAEEVRKQEAAAVIAEIKAKIAQYGISAKDLGFAGASAKKSAGDAAAPAAAKFKGPNGELWSGMGRQPLWLKDALAQGRTKDDFAI